MTFKIFDQLESLVKSFKVGDILNGNHFITVNKTDNSVHNEQKVIYIDASIFKNDADKEKFVQQVSPLIEQSLDIGQNPNGILIENEQAYQNLLPAVEYNNNQDEEIESFIKNNIPLADQSMWRVSLVMASKMNSIVQADKETVKQLKQQLSAYGSRGKNIANLGSSGHLQSLVIPAYNGFISIDHENGKRGFLKYYNDVVEHSPTAVFVNAYEKHEDILEETVNKIRDISRYGQNTVCVFGVGKTNSDKISDLQNCLETKKSDYGIKTTSIFNQNGVVKLSIVIKSNGETPVI